MKRITLLRLFFLVGFLVLMTIFTTVGPVFSETTLNDNVNIEGALSLDDEAGGIIFADNSRQTVAGVPPWCQIIPTDERFVPVMKDGEAVLDRETGLVWERKTITGALCHWYAALWYCHTAYIGGRYGWRLPTVAELRTLVDETQIHPFPALPVGHPFDNVMFSYYWSSTTDVNNTANAWIVYFSGGSARSYDKTKKYYVRAVRSGQ